MKRGRVAALVPEYECQVNLQVDIPLAIRASQPVILERARARAEAQVVLLDEHLSTLGQPKFVEGRPDSARQQLIRDMIMICYDYNGNTRKTGYFKVDDCEIVDSVTTIHIHEGLNYLGHSLDRVIRENVLQNYKEVPEYEESAEVEYFLQSIQCCEDKGDFAALYFQPAVGSKVDTAFLLLDATLIARYDDDDDLKMILQETYPNVEQKFKGWEDYEYFEKHVTPGQFPDNFGGVLNLFETVCHHYNEYVGTSQSLAKTVNKFLILFPTLPLDCFQLLEVKGFDFEGKLLIMDQWHIASVCTTESLCWNCLEHGHMASNCPTKGICHTCGKAGHRARDCTAAPMPPLCHNCCKRGHFAVDCTNEKACKNCLKTGHLAYQCPSGRFMDR